MRYLLPLIVLQLAIHATMCNCGWAVISAYEFSGTVIQRMSNPFEYDVPAFSPVSGRFEYETSSVLTHPSTDCDCAGYAQRRYSGLTVEFEGLTVRADEYVVAIVNNNEGGGFDTFSISIDPFLDPPIITPLVVNDVPESSGMLVISFVSNPSAFLDTSLPDSPDLQSFSSAFNVLDDSGAGSDLLFSIDSVAPVDNLLGDYDHDLDVDGGDFLHWQNTFGSTVTLSADGDGSGEIDLPDLVLWEHRFGFLIDAVTLEALPEPNAFTLMLMLVSMASCVRLDRFTENESNAANL